MNIGKGIAITGIWIACSIAVSSGNATGDIFGAAVVGTFFIAFFG